MGVDIHVRVAERDPKTNEWKEIKLYEKDKKGNFKLKS